MYCHYTEPMYRTSPPISVSPRSTGIMPSSFSDVNSLPTKDTTLATAPIKTATVGCLIIRT